LASGGGGGGGECGSCESDEQNTYTPPPSQTLSSKYTQKEFTRLSKREIGKLWGLYGKDKKGGKTVVIDGFSEGMVQQLVDMIYYDRTSTKRLIRDMSKIKGEEARKKRLSEEVIKTEKRIADLEAAFERAKKKNLKSATYETNERIRDAKKYLKAVKVWAKYPGEGAR